MALAKIKENLNDAENLSFAEALDGEIRRHVFCMGTEDSTEAARPSWTSGSRSSLGSKASTSLDMP